MVTPDHVADLVLAKYEALSPKFKPRARDGGQREWTVLSGIVLARNDGHAECISLATGLKCLPATRFPGANGLVLHDWHAEVLAIRAFNRWLLDECTNQLEQDAGSPWIVRSDATSRIKLQEGIAIHMYCSEAPCGDASMELVMAQQSDPTPWTESNSQHSPESGGRTSTFHGRGYFSQLGVVRTKPSRPDAPPTSSKSCSDKLALKQCTSLLNSIANLIFDPRSFFLDILVLPASQHVPSATQRAFGPLGRMSVLADQPQSDHESDAVPFRPFEVLTTTKKFVHGRRSDGDVGCRYIASNISAVWTPHLSEVLIGGVLQGRKQSDPKRASAVSRKRTWMQAVALADLMEPRMAQSLETGTYGALKRCGDLADRRAVKAFVRGKVLKGWESSVADESFSLQTSGGVGLLRLAVDSVGIVDAGRESVSQQTQTAANRTAVGSKRVQHATN